MMKIHARNRTRTLPQLSQKAYVNTSQFCNISLNKAFRNVGRNKDITTQNILTQLAIKS